MQPNTPARTPTINPFRHPICFASNKFKPSSKVRDVEKGDVERKVMLCLDVIFNIKAIREGILMDAMCESGFASFMCGIRCMWGV
ncbi:hypothetical protein Q3G72_014099 [Acer saccharum]|nr:hypothetical protein Q3G72_014099 [Acer saccharum]